MEHFRAFFAWVDLTIEQLVISLLILSIWLLYRKLSCLQYKYNQLDKLVFAHALIISNKFDIKTVKIHRKSDYEVNQPINDITED